MSGALRSVRLSINLPPKYTADVDNMFLVFTISFYNLQLRASSLTWRRCLFFFYILQFPVNKIFSSCTFTISLSLALIFLFFLTHLRHRFLKFTTKYSQLNHISLIYLDHQKEIITNQKIQEVSLMKRNLWLYALTAAMAASMGMTAFAGQWYRTPQAGGGRKTTAPTRYPSGNGWMEIKMASTNATHLIQTDICTRIQQPRTAIQ